MADSGKDTPIITREMAVGSLVTTTVTTGALHDRLVQMRNSRDYRGALKQATESPGDRKSNFTRIEQALVNPTAGTEDDGSFSREGLPKIMESHIKAVQGASNRAYSVYEASIDKLTKPEALKVRQEILRTMIEEPALRKVVESMLGGKDVQTLLVSGAKIPKEVEDLINNFAGDPGVRAILGTKLEEIRKKYDMPQDQAEVELRAQRSNVAVEVDSIKTRAGKLDEQIREQDRIISRFTVKYDKGGKPIFNSSNTLAKALHDTRDSITGREVEIAKLREEIKDPKTPATDIPTKKAEIATKEKEINRLKAEIESLEKAREQAIKRKAELEKLKPGLDGALAKAQGKLQEIDTKLRVYDSKRAELALQMSGDYERVIGDSVKELIDQQVEESQRLFMEEIDRAREEVQEKYGRLLEDKMRQDFVLTKGPNRWLLRFRGILEFNKHSIDNAYQTLIRQGPDSYIKSQLEDVIKNDVKKELGLFGKSKLHPEEEAIVKREADKRLEEAQKTYGVKVAKDILGYKINTGGISETEANMIMTTDWGQEAIDKALEKNQEKKALIDKLKNQGALRKDIPWLKILILLFIFGAIGITVFKTGAFGLLGGGNKG